jgi:hypothetical protein
MYSVLFAQLGIATTHERFRDLENAREHHARFKIQ